MHNHSHQVILFPGIFKPVISYVGNLTSQKWHHQRTIPPRGRQNRLTGRGLVNGHNHTPDQTMKGKPKGLKSYQASFGEKGVVQFGNVRHQF